MATAMLRSVAALAPLRASFRSSASPRILGPTEPSRLLRLFASTSDDKKGAKKEAKPKQKKITKWKLNPNITQDNADRLALAFDEMARKEGFDGSSAHFAQDATFEDDFEYDLDDEDREIDGDDLDPDMIFDADDEEDDDDDDFIDFGGRPGQSMEERIAAAQRDMDFGTITVPKGLDSFSEKATFDQLKKLGYKRELNPFGNDETPRREQFLLSTNALTCSACGSDFQSKNEGKPGFLPVEKHDIQRKLAKMEELQKMQEKADSSNAEWSPDDEIDYLLSITDGEKKDDNADKFARLDIDSVAEELGLDFNELSKKKVICKRCHGLQNFGKVDEVLRPGWTDEPLLSQKQFRDLLLPLKQKPAVIIAIVDLFDFSGSVLPELDNIAGKNPVLLAANKADLLPDKLGPNRAQNWVRRELEYLGVKSIANIGGAVRLISCKTGFGIPDLLRKARSLAEDLDCEIYVVGAANAGKSSFINHILERNNMTPDNAEKEKKRPGNQTSRKGALTTSPLPGTTLKFIKIKLGDGRVLYDTPGLLIPGTLTQLLTPEELKIVVPTKKVEPITFRFGAEQCVLIGGLARIEAIGDTLPFLFTFYIANGVKLHPTKSARADAFVEAHAGIMLTPPLEPGPERMAQIGEFEEHIVTIDGAGWKEAAADITLRGLGWVAVTGAGKAQLRIMVPKGIGVSVRPPLMPFDVWETTAKYTGGRAIRKSSKSKSGKRRSGVGRN